MQVIDSGYWFVIERYDHVAFAQGRGPDPAATDNTADFASTAVLEDPLQQ